MLKIRAKGNSTPSGLHISAPTSFRNIHLTRNISMTLRVSPRSRDAQYASLKILKIHFPKYSSLPYHNPDNVS